MIDWWNRHVTGCQVSTVRSHHVRLQRAVESSQTVRLAGLPQGGHTIFVWLSQELPKDKILKGLQ